MVLGIIILVLCVFFCFYEEPKYKCEICKDTKEVEVLVMGTDTELVKCEYCNNKE